MLERGPRFEAERASREARVEDAALQLPEPRRVEDGLDLDARRPPADLEELEHRRGDAGPDVEDPGGPLERGDRCRRDVPDVDVVPLLRPVAEDVRCLAAVERQAGVFNVGTGVATSVLELFEVCRRVSGVDMEPVFDPPRLGELQRSVLDTGLAGRELGFTAETSFDDGIAVTWESIRRGLKEEGEAEAGAN